MYISLSGAVAGAPPDMEAALESTGGGGGGGGDGETEVRRESSALVLRRHPLLC